MIANFGIDDPNPGLIRGQAWFGPPAVTAFGIKSDAYLDAKLRLDELDRWHVIPNFDRVAFRGLVSMYHQATSFSDIPIPCVVSTTDPQIRLATRYSGAWN